MSIEDDEARARGRFMVLNMVRITGLAMVLGGILIAERGLVEPRWIGYVLMALGLFDFFFVPNLLRRAWTNSDK